MYTLEVHRYIFMSFIAAGGGLETKRGSKSRSEACTNTLYYFCQVKWCLGISWHRFWWHLSLQLEALKFCYLLNNQISFRHKHEGSPVVFCPRLNIRSIINMQLTGEHAHCGPPLDPKSGFTYSPQIFMDNDSEILLCWLRNIWFHVKKTDWAKTDCLWWHSWFCEPTLHWCSWDLWATSNYHVD